MTEGNNLTGESLTDWSCKRVELEKEDSLLGIACFIT